MKAFFFKKIKHIAHEGFCRKNKHNMCLAKASAKKFTEGVYGTPRYPHSDTLSIAIIHFSYRQKLLT